ncbi:PDPFL protein, partial [Chordeiles acutipennis]|nr:PDPFL protein [Chordeiles acutipennis]
MASVPSAGCLLAKNQYYRSKCAAGRGWGGGAPGGGLGPPSLSGGALRVVATQEKSKRLPELVDKFWWIKSFFHNEPSPPTVGRKTLSAS